MGGAALVMEKGSSRVLNGTLLLKLGLDSLGVSNLVKTCPPGRQKLRPDLRMENVGPREISQRQLQ